MIATSQPSDIEKAVQGYNAEAQSLEEAYMDLILASGGAFNYQDIMTMPIDSIALLIQRLNKRSEEAEAAMRKSTNSR